MHRVKSKNRMDRGKSTKRINKLKGPGKRTPDLLDFKKLRKEVNYVLGNTKREVTTHQISYPFFGYICGKAGNMNALEIKTNFHQLIDQINNDQLLIKLYRIMEQASSTADGQLWSRLTEDEQIELLKIEGEVQSDHNLIPNQQMQTKHQKWL